MSQISAPCVTEKLTEAADDSRCATVRGDDLSETSRVVVGAEELVREAIKVAIDARDDELAVELLAVLHRRRRAAVADRDT